MWFVFYILNNTASLYPNIYTSLGSVPRSGIAEAKGIFI